MGHILGKDREQVKFLCLEEMVEADSPARQIDRLVDETDTSYFVKSEPNEMGRPPYDPKDLLKLHIYGYENRAYSSRLMKRECRCNIEAMWLMKGLQPDDKTICNFRRDNAEQIKRFFNEYCQRLAEDGYIDGKIVAIDGTKIRANNSKRNNYSQNKLNNRIGRLDERISGLRERLGVYLDEIEKNDKLDELEERKTKYEGYKERIEGGEVSEVSTTDPDSRLMRQGNGGADVSYNVQTAVDGKYKLVAGFMVTNEPNDQGQLYKVAKSVKDNLGLESMTVPADKGYYDTDDIKACEDDNIITIAAKPEDKGPKDEFKFKKEDFRYDKYEDVFICPAGKKLKASKPDKNGYKRYRTPGACSHCPIKSKCTIGERKDLGRHQYADYAERNDERFKANPDIYKLRQLLSEHPFGTIKRTMGIRQFLMRGLTNTNGEAALIFLAYNLKRMRNIHKNENGKEGNTLDSARLFIVFLIFASYRSAAGKRKSYVN